MELIKPVTRDIGFPVRRLLPAAGRQRVGPFIFFDHMGPHRFPEGSHDGDVRPHPHIGLATVTYLFSGAMMHRDSLGTVQRIEPGEINLMSAGRGIVHSERMPEDVRASGVPVEGIQTWLALPEAFEDDEPAFSHHPIDTLPVYQDRGVRARVLLGEAFELRSPVVTDSPALYLDIELEAGASLPLPPSVLERAIYVVSGEPRASDEPLPTHHVMVLESGRSWLLEALDRPARLMLFGGEPLPGRRHIHWNFVSSHPERIERAREDWRHQRFAPVPDEHEWIPLPEDQGREPLAPTGGERIEEDN
ncbi:hypothetical protein CEK62_08990 [Alcanivorax sp. N3-2A]|nr:hypothetical protein CEK62_08990 [Alcanivorax sp. N3-2A]|tara:strand:+ start:21760 stop:22674 length:915 start_codon:yes stop_codon:yes gene_type:complete